MIYRVLGLMSGSSLDGLDIAYVHLHSGAGKWGYTLVDAETLHYPPAWQSRLEHARSLDALEYLVLDQDYGRFIGEQVNAFIEARGLDFQVQLVASHGHTVFHFPARAMTAQLGNGGAIAGVTGLQVVTDLRSLDVALGGQGAPIVPIGERWLFPDYAYFLNLGGIANVSDASSGLAWDVCPANRVLNLLAAQNGEPFDKGGVLAASGKVLPSLLEALAAPAYFAKAAPKSLDNAFSLEQFRLICDSGCSVTDGLRTYVEHIALQVGSALRGRPAGDMLVTGGGAHHAFLVERLTEALEPIRVIIPEVGVVDFKEALVVALFGILRLRQEENTLASVTGASRNSIGGALWNGGEA